MTSLLNKKIAIIGAGISGLTLANKLDGSNKITIFDKSRGMGGRMATRRAEDFHFDHGAQFFTTKSNEFKELCANAKMEGVIDIWQARFVEVIDFKINKKWQFDETHPHYVGVPQMNNLCKYLAKNLDVRLGKKITKINFNAKKWFLTSEEGEEFADFDYLILAIPPAQALDLLPTNFQYLDEIKNIKMQGCFALMLGFKKQLDLEFDACLVKNAIISWVSLNSSKPGRPEGFSLLINSSNDWADANIEKDLDLAKKELISELQKIIKFDLADIAYENIHRWRYANAKIRKGNKSLFDSNLNLGICADYLISGRVEHGFLSALDLCQKIKASN